MSKELQEHVYNMLLCDVLIYLKVGSLKKKILNIFVG